MANAKGGQKSMRQHLIPNAGALFTEEELIYSKEPSYNAHSDGPHSNRLNNIGRGIVAGVTEKVLKAIPDLPTGVIGAFVNPIKQGYTENCNALKHSSFGEAGKVSFLPGISSLYSLYAMSWGLTAPDVTAVLTKEADDGKEALLGFERKGGRFVSPKNLEDVYNGEAVYAGVLSELMNREIDKSNIKDVTKFMKVFAANEVFIYGAKGKRSAVKRDSDGKMIFRYERPSRGEFFKYYLTNDMTYTLLDWATNLAGSTLPEIAGQRFYEGEVDQVIKYSQNNYGNLNISGAPNPFAAGYRNGNGA